MSNYDLIKSAIQNKQQVHAYYGGYYREMCPHVIGTKNGDQQALFYQFAGESSKGAVEPGSRANWRCMKIDQLVDVSVKSGEWHTFDNHSIPQTCVDSVDIEVDFPT